MTTSGLFLALVAFVPVLLPGPPTHRCAVQQPPQLVMIAADEPRERAPWAQRLRSAGTAIATAVVLAVPRGPARAAVQELSAPDAAPVTRSLHYGRAQRKEPEAAFLWFQRKKELLPQFLPGTRKRRSTDIDMDVLVPKKMATRFTDREFIFSDALTAKSELEEELEDLETYKAETASSRSLQTLVTTGGAVGLCYFSVKGLTGVEKWIKDQERKDIEEEMELTGTYISVDAGDVDSAIDPKTGKNLTISRGQKTSSTSGEDDDGTPKEAPWFLRVLGLGGSVAADDDTFWEAPAPTAGPENKKKGGGSGGDAEGGDGDGGDGEGGDDDDDDDDDSSGIDELDDLMS